MAKLNSGLGDGLEGSLGGLSYYKMRGQAYDHMPTEEFRSEWYPIVKGAPAIDKERTLSVFPPDTDFTLVLSIGICYGIMETADYVRQAPYVGSAKILAVG